LHILILKKILVIGAGDGGVIRELIKHENVEEIIWCEIDKKVIEYCEKYFPTLSNANHNKKVKINCNDAFIYVQNTPNNYFDIIISDTTDPEGFGEALFSEKFYKDCHRILKPGGILATQGECIWHSLPLISKIINFSNNIFDHCQYYGVYVPFYPFGEIGIIICSQMYFVLVMLCI